MLEGFKTDRSKSVSHQIISFRMIARPVSEFSIHWGKIWVLCFTKNLCSLCMIVPVQQTFQISSTDTKLSSTDSLNHATVSKHPTGLIHMVKHQQTINKQVSTDLPPTERIHLSWEPTRFPARQTGLCTLRVSQSHFELLLQSITNKQHQPIHKPNH